MGQEGRKEGEVVNIQLCGVSFFNEKEIQVRTYRRVGSRTA